MSNTATWGCLRHRRPGHPMPARLAGLCSGASGDSRSMATSTASSITVGAENSMPPITTRCPTAASSESSSEGRRSEGVEHATPWLRRGLPRRDGDGRVFAGAVALTGLGLTDAFDVAVGPAPGRGRLDQLVLDRRRAAVEHEHDGVVAVTLPSIPTGGRRADGASDRSGLGRGDGDRVDDVAHRRAARRGR